MVLAHHPQQVQVNITVIRHSAFKQISNPNAQTLQHTFGFQTRSSKAHASVYKPDKGLRVEGTNGICAFRQDTCVRRPHKVSKTHPRLESAAIFSDMQIAECWKATSKLDGPGVPGNAGP